MKMVENFFKALFFCGVLTCGIYAQYSAERIFLSHAFGQNIQKALKAEFGQEESIETYNKNFCDCIARESDASFRTPHNIERCIKLFNFTLNTWAPRYQKYLQQVHSFDARNAEQENAEYARVHQVVPGYLKRYQNYFENVNGKERA